MKKRLLISSTLTSTVLMAGAFLWFSFSKEENAPSINEISTPSSYIENIPLPPIYIEKEVQLKNRQTISELLKVENIPPSLTAQALHSLQRKYNVRQLRPGQTFTLTFTDGDDHYKLSNIHFYGPDDKQVTLTREASDGFDIKVEKRTLQTVTEAVEGTIDDSLYASAKKAGLPAALVPAFANLFAWELDFTRDIRPGATFRVVYERILDEKGSYLRSGNILAAELTTHEKTFDAYRTIEEGGWVEYFSSKGYNKKRTLLRTPLEFSRISSHYNLRRKHPVLGYTRAHKGTDFAAPTGTPIKAAGDGVVERASWYGGYGRYVRIRHDKTFTTAYAHLSRYARGMKAGKRVRQGEIIGFVGTSGRSTGPHLHYEILRNGVHVNPMTVQLPTSARVKKEGLKEFEAMVKRYQAMWAELPLKAE